MERKKKKRSKQLTDINKVSSIVGSYLVYADLSSEPDVVLNCREQIFQQHQGSKFPKSHCFLHHLIESKVVV